METNRKHRMYFGASDSSYSLYLLLFKSHICNDSYYVYAEHIENKILVDCVTKTQVPSKSRPEDAFITHVYEI